MPPSSEPYCGNCGYQLGGLVDSSKCPECGRPLVEVLSRTGQWGKRYRSSATIFGLPVVDYAFGPRPGEPVGKPRGIFAIGDAPIGVVAIGGFSRGVVAIGGMAMGVVTFGGLSLGLLGAAGGLAVGAMAFGGLAIGVLASGGMAVGVVSSGGLPIGWYAAGGSPIGPHRMGPGVSSPEAAAVFQRFSWFFGRTTATTLIKPIVAISGLAVALSGIAGLLALMGSMRHGAKGGDGETFPPPTT